ncbi:Alpha/Beta hydrolase protein [Bombardia bombarda]|uniref:Alpha/Beta hydrolase protein n=1 Tax=Bombardia bombarda TaxID=252184 RepID=A0AA39TK46_9PEZI|nr:Alpha/Beta hydrolase protein [Bombardia bombarda]
MTGVKPASYLVPSLVLGLPLVLYITFLGLSAIPLFQRNFLYAHKIHTLWWSNLWHPVSWGFADNQVNSFNLHTSDGERLHAWHILPLPLYAAHEHELAHPSMDTCDLKPLRNFEYFRDDPTSGLVISFHGNTGHIAQAIRPAHFRSLTSISNIHVLTISYRGFGLSTGTPTEPGLILDAITAINWAIHDAGVPPSRIVLMGHSLGTAVTSAALEHFAHEGVDFAGVVLVSAFSSLPTMLSGYAIAGFLPVLAPLKISSWLLRHAMEYVVDKWPSADRLRETVRVVKGRGGRLRLHMVHAADDWDIPCHEDDKLFKAAVEGTFREGVGMDEETLAREKEVRTVGSGNAFAATWKDGDVVIRQERFPNGGEYLALRDEMRLDGKKLTFSRT